MKLKYENSLQRLEQQMSFFTVVADAGAICGEFLKIQFSQTSFNCCTFQKDL